VHGPSGGVHTGAGGAEDEASGVDEITSEDGADGIGVATAEDERATDEFESEDVCAAGIAVDDTGFGLEELDMVADAAGNELGVEELDVDLDRLWEEVWDEARDDETALQLPKPCWHPVPQ
jgi:hypothetical protein